MTKYFKKISGKEIDPMIFSLKVHGQHLEQVDICSLYPSKCLTEKCLKVCLKVLSKVEDTRIDILGDYSMFDLDFYDKFYNQIYLAKISEEEKHEKFRAIFTLEKVQGDYKKFLVFMCRSATGNFLVLINNF